MKTAQSYSQSNPSKCVTQTVILSSLDGKTHLINAFGASTSSQKIQTHLQPHQVPPKQLLLHSAPTTYQVYNHWYTSNMRHRASLSIPPGCAPSRLAIILLGLASRLPTPQRTSPNPLRPRTDTQPKHVKGFNPLSLNVVSPHLRHLTTC